MTNATCKCGHAENRHEANECWTDRDTGEETWGSTEVRMCQCDWYEPAGVGGPWDKWHAHVQHP
jgi:hypothetical protein